jgi:hypothetical protein
MNASFIRIFSAAKIRFPNGHDLSIDESKDGVYNVIASDPKGFRIGISEADSVHYVFLEDLIRTWQIARQVV